MNFTILIIWLIAVLKTDHIITPNDLSRTLGYISKETIELVEYAFYRASEKDINPEKFLLLMYCESQLVPKGGDWNEKTNQYDSNGLLQFQKPTFEDFSKLYKFEGDYNNSKDQIQLASLMIRDGYWKHWLTCGKRSKLNLDYESPPLVLNRN